MATKSIMNDVLNAASVSLLSPVSVHGYNNYILSTNLITWDETNSYLLTALAENFGQKAPVTIEGQVAFKCGNANISLFDFGLLICCFTAISVAKAESGLTIQTECSKADSDNSIDVAWFGATGVVYSVKHRLLFTLRSDVVQKACKHNHVKIQSFIDTEVYMLYYEGSHLVVTNYKEEFVCSIPIPAVVHRMFPELFEYVPPIERPEVDTILDIKSPLGSIVSTVLEVTTAKEILEKYKATTVLDSVVVRSDLICTPTVRYTDVKSFLGSLCYTDRHEIALAINFRKSLFVYKSWFCGDTDDIEAIQVSHAPDFQRFFNVTKECSLVMQYAKTVTQRPITAGEFNLSMFNAIKEAFRNMKLLRLPLASSFGRVVIPEDVLIDCYSSLVGENIYCIVPVGVIGKNVIVLNASGKLESMKNMPWDHDSYFYDITEVLYEVQRDDD